MASEISNSFEQPSVLDDLGEEVTGIIAPVSLCMAITVLLVRILNPDGADSSSNAVVIASLAYNEDSTDSSGQKFSGALLNAIIFAAIMAGMTFILVLLFKYGCFRVIYVYMAFAVFDIFFLITAIVFVDLLQTLDIHIDAFSFMYGLFNFAVVGTVGVLFIPIPLLAKQGYMIWTGIMTAYIFTWVPEWTSWVLICVMALYDIAAVLIPGGPLNMLIKVATERQEMIPALVYEARPARGPYQPNVLRPRRRDDNGNGDDAPTDVTSYGGAPGVLPANAQQHYNGNPSYGQVPPAVPPIGLAPGQVSASYRPPSPDQRTRRLSGSPRSHNQATPVVASGSAPVVPYPAGNAGSRPGSARNNQLPSQEGQEMMSIAAHGMDGPGHVSFADGRYNQAGGRPLGEATDQYLQYTGAGPPGPVAEGKELADEHANVPWRPLPGNDGSQSPTSRPESPGLGTGNLPPLSGRSQGGIGSYSNQQPPSPLRPVSAGYGGSQSGGPDHPSHGNSRLQHAGYPQAGGGANGHPHPHPDMARGQDPVPPGGVPPGAGSGPGQVVVELPDSIKLGLGDFIFYSMLVGRAAMYDFMTVFSSYLGIIAGLGITLLCLAFYQRALPALPFSVTLGVIFYFLTRLVMEPFLAPMAASLTYF